MVEPRLVLAAIVRAAIGHEQDLRSAFLQCFANVSMPRILTNWAANTQPIHRVRPTHRPHIKNTDLIKDSFIGQMMLEHPRAYFAALQHIIGVVKSKPLNRRPPNGQGRAIAAFKRQSLNRLNRRLMKNGLHYKVLRVVARDKHLRQRKHIHTRIPGCLPGNKRLGLVHSDVPNGWVELSQHDTECLGHSALQSKT